MIKENIGLILISVISILYLILVGGYVVNLEDFNSLKLNEKGDLLSGVFSPLAFLWLVYGYLQQGHELKQNSKSLGLQANELKQSVEEQKKLIKIHEEEQKIRFEQAKPIFVFENLRFDPEQLEQVESDAFTGEIGYEHKQQDVSFHIKNLGSSVKEVSIFRNDRLITSIDLLEKGDKKFITLYLTDEEQSNLHKEAVFELQFVLSYFDMLGLKYLEVYRIELDERFEHDDGMDYYECHLEKINTSQK